MSISKKEKNVIDPKIMFEGAATLIVALAVNNTVREIINHIWPSGENGGNKIVANIVYTVCIIIIVLISIYTINKISNSETVNNVLKFCSGGRCNDFAQPILIHKKYFYN